MSHDAILKSNIGERRNPDIIYQCYQPINVTELREYMLFCVAQDIQASHKTRDEEIPLSPSPRGESEDASTK